MIPHISCHGTKIRNIENKNFYVERIFQFWKIDTTPDTLDTTGPLAVRPKVKSKMTDPLLEFLGYIYRTIFLRGLSTKDFLSTKVSYEINIGPIYSDYMHVICHIITMEDQYTIEI
jgi:hypothetical protein